MIEHVVFFLEEPSAEDFLRGILPRLLPAGVSPHFLVFEGKQDLEKFDRPALHVHDRSAKYRNPDAVGSPSQELRRVIQSYQKRDGARRIAPLLLPERNRSSSFQALYRALSCLASS